MKLSLNVLENEHMPVLEWQIPALYRNLRCIVAATPLSVLKGGWTVLLGNSGVGKTTLLRCLAGLSQSAPCKDLISKTSYMAQHDALLPWKTVLKNVMIGDLLRQKPVKVDHATALLERVGLVGREYYLPAMLSVGMRQRVALARTLYEEADLVLLDEPFSSLDTGRKQELYKLSKQLLKDKTVIHVTHDPLEALQLADEIFIMQDQPAIIKKYNFSKQNHGLKSLDDALKTGQYAALMERILCSKV